MNIPYSIAIRNQTAQPFIDRKDYSIPDGKLTSDHYPFSLNQKIARIILDSDKHFVEAQYFEGRNGKIFIIGKLYEIIGEDPATNIHEVSISSDRFEICLELVSHQNSFIFIRNNSIFVNYIIHK